MFFQCHRNRIEWWSSGAGGRGKWGDVGQRVQMFSLRRVSSEDLRHGMVTSCSRATVHSEVAEIVSILAAHTPVNYMNHTR